MSSPAMLHMLCGKIASGKSTLAAQLAGAENSVLIAEDAWLAALYPDQLTSLSDFVRCTRALRGIMGPHISDVLRAGTSVVLDFQANTVESRSWMRGVFEAADAAHELHVLDVPDAVCLERLRERNAGGDHPFAVTEAQFHQFSKHFVLPTDAEGFTIETHKPNS